MAVGTAGFWETFEGMRRIREFRRVPEWCWSIAGAVLPVVWITLVQTYLHPMNILVYGVISIIYMMILQTRRWEIWSSVIAVAIQIVFFLWVPIWHSQGNRFWLILIAELLGLLLYSYNRNPSWGLLVILAWMMGKPLLFHVTDQWNDIVDLSVLTVLLFLYAKEGARRMKIVYERGHDPLTRLLNRMSFMDWLLEKGKVFGTMALIDLDDFKFANDTFGHQVGDQILEEVGRRLQRINEAQVYRWGGDEFIILLPGLATQEQAEPTIQKLHDEITRDPYIGKEKLRILASMGVASGILNQDLIVKADMALLQIKRSGKNRVGWYVEVGDPGKVEITTESHLKWVSDSLRYLMEHSTKGFLLTDVSHRILDINPVFETMSGYHRAELMGQSPKMLASPHHLNKMKYPEIKEKLNNLGWWKGSFINKRPNGEVWMASDEISAVKVGEETVGFWALVEEDSIFDLEHELLSAMEREEFQVYLQPKCTGDGRVIGAETLIRWMHHERGIISPLEFISVAENNGLIIPIGYWVFHEVCVLSQRLEDMDVPIPLSINVSPIQFHDSKFTENISKIIRDTGVNRELLVLEVTEGILIDRVEEAIAKLEELHHLGFRISLDDFGTGYSSLAYLKDLHLDELKIDQSFVRSMAQSESSQIILSSILSLAKQLHLQVVAEGVETDVQLDFLRKNGCEIFQGYYFGQPMSAEKFISLFQTSIDPHSSEFRNLYSQS